jgi:hypothetical protein
MEYRGVEFHVVQTANPTGWKWTVHLKGGRTRTGDSFSRNSAMVRARFAIDKALPKEPDPPMPGIIAVEPASG